MSTPSEQTAPLSWTAALTVRPGTPEPLSDPTLAYLASLSPKGRQTMVERLRAVARALDVPDAAIRWHELRFQHVEFIRARLAERGWPPRRST